jgi:hypothetical protein
VAQNIKGIKVETPQGRATTVELVPAKAGGSLVLVRYRSGATWLYAPGEIETLSAADTARLDAAICNDAPAGAGDDVEAYRG